DSLIGTAARALAAGDPLAALNCVALRHDAPALALRGIALAQLGEFPQARKLLLRAQRSFEAAEVVARARCAVAAAEVALFARDFGGEEPELGHHAEVLERHGDRLNANFARMVGVRRAIWLGRLAAAEQWLSGIDEQALPPRFYASFQLIRAELALRRLRTGQALEALTRAEEAARLSGIPALLAEVARARAELELPVARSVHSGGERPLRLAEVEQLHASGRFVVDACRRELRANNRVVALVSRPVLFTLARTLAQRAPAPATRDELIADAFEATQPNESHRARLRVEIGRLRKLLLPIASVNATAVGFALSPRDPRGITLLLPLEPGDESAVLALLGGGEAWSSSALATALGKSQRSLQRALSELEQSGRIVPLGKGRQRKWIAPASTGFATALLLVQSGGFG
ncbi:MAG TPA: helix-turn-helix domain-containing protein, partial [Polyangiaceae bacterium]|nr:helix-turn-helix domain-containing protein [Polyangiaceae bacterium]